MRREQLQERERERTNEWKERREVSVGHTYPHNLYTFSKREGEEEEEEQDRREESNKERRQNTSKILYSILSFVLTLFDFPRTSASCIGIQNWS